MRAAGRVEASIHLPEHPIDGRIALGYADRDTTPWNRLGLVLVEHLTVAHFTLPREGR